jgi:hypothetical protein
MTEMVVQITKDELRRLIDEVLEEKLIQLFGDPDEGLLVNDALKKRLLQQKETTAKGERGKLLDDVIADLGL